MQPALGNRKIVVTQIDWNGEGDDRNFSYHPAATAVGQQLERIARAYAFNGRTKVTLDGRDITDDVAALKP